MMLSIKQSAHNGFSQKGEAPGYVGITLIFSYPVQIMGELSNPNFTIVPLIGIYYFIVASPHFFSLA